MSVPNLTIGLDVGDKYTQLHSVDSVGETVEQGRLRTTPAALRVRFSGIDRARVVLEVGIHSPWMSRLLEELGHEVLVANPRSVHARAEDKTDAIDAEALARWGRSDPRMLRPVRHRREATQQDLACVRARDALMRTRTKLINHVRGAVKSMGCRIPKCSADAFHRRAPAHIPVHLKPALTPVVETIGDLTVSLRAYDRVIISLCAQSYPDTARLTQVCGVGPVTALAYVLVLEDPQRFISSRAVGAYLGLRPRQRESGDAHPELRISKRGDELLRRLLVQCAHYLLGPFGPDCDLRRWGLRLLQRGGQNAKKRAEAGRHPARLVAYGGCLPAIAYRGGTGCMSELVPTITTSNELLTERN